MLPVEDAAAQLAGAADANTHTPAAGFVMAIGMHNDETFFGVFTAVDREAVTDMCRRAGWPAHRISDDVHVWSRPTGTDN